jgi:hypothetical protein
LKVEVTGAAKLSLMKNWQQLWKISAVGKWCWLHGEHILKVFFASLSNLIDVSLFDDSV